MSRTQLTGLFAALLFVGPVAAADPGTDPTPQELQRQLNDVKKDISKIKEDIDNLKTGQLATQTVMADLRKLLDRMDQMQKTMDAMSRTNSQTRTSFSSPIGQPARVRILNDYTTDVTAIVAGMTYRIPPGTEQNVSVNPGTVSLFIYDVHSTVQSRLLAPNEVLTFRVYPR